MRVTTFKFACWPGRERAVGFYSTKSPATRRKSIRPHASLGVFKRSQQPVSPQLSLMCRSPTPMAFWRPSACRDQHAPPHAGGPQTNVTHKHHGAQYLVFVPVTVPEIALLSSVDVAGNIHRRHSATIDNVVIGRNHNSAQRQTPVFTACAPPRHRGWPSGMFSIVGASVVMNYQFEFGGLLQRASSC